MPGRQAVPEMTIHSLQPGHGWPPSGTPPGLNDLFRDNSAYRIGPWDLRLVARESQLAFSHHAGHPCLTENSIIGETRLPQIQHAVKIIQKLIIIDKKFDLDTLYRFI